MNQMFVRMGLLAVVFSGNSYGEKPVYSSLETVGASLKDLGNSWEYIPGGSGKSAELTEQENVLLHRNPRTDVKRWPRSPNSLKKLSRSLKSIFSPSSTQRLASLSAPHGQGSACFLDITLKPGSHHFPDCNSQKSLRKRQKESPYYLDNTGNRFSRSEPFLYSKVIKRQDDHDYEDIDNIVYADPADFEDLKRQDDNDYEYIEDNSVYADPADSKVIKRQDDGAYKWVYGGLDTDPADSKVIKRQDDGAYKWVYGGLDTNPADSEDLKGQDDGAYKWVYGGLDTNPADSEDLKLKFEELLEKFAQKAMAEKTSGQRNQGSVKPSLHHASSAILTEPKEIQKQEAEYQLELKKQNITEEEAPKEELEFLKNEKKAPEKKGKDKAMKNKKNKTFASKISNFFKKA